jgi:hypothetical protein
MQDAEPVTQLSDLGRRGCECIGCERLFWGVSAFDKHRVGRPATNHRCATEAEIAQAGLRQDERDVWFDAAERLKASDRRDRAAETVKKAAA